MGTQTIALFVEPKSSINSQLGRQFLCLSKGIRFGYSSLIFDYLTEGWSINGEDCLFSKEKTIMEKLSENTNALNWFEIPISDIERAKAFYESAFDIQLHPMEMMGMTMLMFPSQSPKSGGALVKSDYHFPSDKGSLIYLNGNPDLQLVIDRIEEAGGEIAMAKTLIDEETGYMAFFRDSEGNLVGLHSGQ